MKRKITQFTVCCLIVLFTACTSEEKLEPAFLETMEKVEFQKEESLSRTLPTFSNKRTNSRSASTNYGTLDLDKIYKTMASEDQELPNYMIRLYPPNEVQNSLEYLVMIGTNYGFRAYILQYQTTPEHINSIHDPTIYTGYINILDMERELLAQNYYINGTDSQLPQSANGRSTGTSCDCVYEIIDLQKNNDMTSSYVVGIVCNCQQLGDPGSDNGAGGIGDPMPDPGYDPSNPDAGGGGGSGSDDGEPGGITRDPVGTVKDAPCDPGEVYISSGLCVNEIDYWKNQIDQESNPEEKRKLQLQYISTHNAQEGRDFKTDIESIIATPGITRGEVDDINKIVNDYWEELVGRLIRANFYPVVEAAKPFVELALIETGSGVLFQAVKGLLSVKWGIQLAKIGINTSSLTTIVNRMKAGLVFAGRGNSSLTLKIGGRNLTGNVYGSSTTSRVTYQYSGVTYNEAKTIFNDMTAGRYVKTVDLGGGKYIKSISWTDSSTKNSITFRNFSSSGQVGDPVIQIKMPEIRTGNIELKFFL
ncbi:MAG: hypothetical protein ACI8Q1_003300 [Parvicella sp.]|jgi:hypothetical protein